MNDSKPGDLSVRIGFARVFGGGPDQGSLRPTLTITDSTSSKSLSIELTGEDIAELLAGGEVRASATRVTGFRGLRDFGKYHKMVTVHVPTRVGDYSADPHDLQYVMEKVDEIKAMGYVCDTPRRNNNSQWVIIGRRYDDQP